MAKPADKQIEVIFTINNQDFLDDKVNPQQKIQVGAKQALTKAGESTELSKWTATFNGIEVSFDDTYEDRKVPNKGRILLTRKPGNKAAGWPS